VALSMEEQRILAEMERNLVADDPRLASRLTSFGQQGLPGTLKSQRVRTIAGLLALAMIAAVTITMFMLSPYVNGRRSDLPRAHPTAGASSAPKATTHSPAASNADTAGAGKTAASHGRTARGASHAGRSSTGRSSTGRPSAGHSSTGATGKASRSSSS
jgi:hypothetical protein